MQNSSISIQIATSQSLRRLAPGFIRLPELLVEKIEEIRGTTHISLATCCAFSIESSGNWWNYQRGQRLGVTTRREEERVDLRRRPCALGGDEAELAQTLPRPPARRVDTGVRPRGGHAHWRASPVCALHPQGGLHAVGLEHVLAENERHPFAVRADLWIARREQAEQILGLEQPLAVQALPSRDATLLAEHVEVAIIVEILVAAGWR